MARRKSAGRYAAALTVLNVSMYNYRNSLALLTLTFIMVVGCQPESSELSEEQSAAITLDLLALEAQTDSITTGAECFENSDRYGDWEPLVVSSGMVFSSKADFLENCAGWSATQTGAGFDVEKSSVEILSPTSALVVRQGIGMVQYERQPEQRFHLVGTSVWKKEGEFWKRLHYHESFRSLETN